MTYKVMQKNNEFLIRSEGDVKPRNLFNPNKVLKAVGGYLNYIYL